MSLTLTVCAEMVFTELPLLERVRRIDALGFGVEIWDWTVKDVDALVATGASFSSMTGYVRGTLTDPEGADDLLRTAADSIPSMSEGARAARAVTANAIAIRWSPADRADPPDNPPPPTRRSSPSSDASPPSERIPLPRTESRSLSLTRSSAPPSNREGPGACEATATRSGTSSMTRGSSLASTWTGRSAPPA